MSGGDGVRNPADLTDIEEQLEDIEDRLILIDAALIIIDNEVGQVHTVVDAIQAMTDALPILTETGGTVTTDGTEQTLYINNAPDGVYKPISLNIDLSNHGATNTIQLRELYRNVAGGALRQRDILPLAGVLESDSIDINLEPNRFGIRVTAQLLAGPNYALTWEVFYEATP